MYSERTTFPPNTYLAPGIAIPVIRLDWRVIGLDLDGLELEIFYEGTMMTEGRSATLADHFQTLDWSLNKIQVAKHKFQELHQDLLRKKRRGTHEVEEFAWFAAAAAECKIYDGNPKDPEWTRFAVRLTSLI